MKRVLQNERGMALAVAIFALVIVGALVAGAFFTGTQEQRVAENTRRLQQSFGVAEAGLTEQIMNWNPATNNAIPTYPANSLAVNQTTTRSMTGSYGGYIYRLNPNLYFLDITGTDTVSRSGAASGGGARQRLGLLTRIRPLQVNVNASLTSAGNVQLKGNAVVDGRDHPVTNPGWDCTGINDTINRAGVRTSGSVSVSGNAVTLGNPDSVPNDTSVHPATFLTYGDVTYDQLAARANIQIAGNVNNLVQPSYNADGTCNKNDIWNWGEPANRSDACGNYFPIIHITGTLTTNNYRGQGILLVDQDINVQGSFDFYGLVIVKGSVKSAGGGTSPAHFWGGVMAQNVNLSVEQLSGNATLNYSKCALVQALQMTGVTAIARSGSWVQLF